MLFEINPRITDRPLMRRDASEAEFDITHFTLFEQAGATSIYIGRYPSNAYDIVFVEDREHLLNGKPYRF